MAVRQKRVAADQESFCRGFHTMDASILYATIDFSSGHARDSGCCFKANHPNKPGAGNAPQGTECVARCQVRLLARG